MAQQINRLSSRGIMALGTGVHADGAGLHLRVKEGGGRYWIYVWHANKRRREIGLGTPPKVDLPTARKKADQARKAVDAGRDPVHDRRKERGIPTFGEAADAFMSDREGSVRNKKSLQRWKRCLGENGYARRLRSISVDQITTNDVLGVLRPLWATKPSSAGLLRGYIETVLNIAKVQGHRSGDNPAAWQGNLAHILPARQRLTRGHHKALAFDEVPALMLGLAEHTSMAARALKFTILTAARTSETLLARWSEFDLAAGVWTVPAARMKAAREHRVPLSQAALELLRDLPKDGGPLLFFGRAKDKPLSNMTMQMLLRRMEIDVTVHGFRSSFRDWAGEMTDVAREVAEAALAHTVGDAAELAYRRGDALEKRRALMEQWASFCAGA